MPLGVLLREVAGRMPAAERGWARHLVTGTLGLAPTLPFTHPEHELDATQCAQVRSNLARWLAGEPLAYVLGRQGFWTMELEVGPEVLIPRPDTEVLVRAALERLPDGASAWLADLGTGSGAVALALALERPELRVLAVERSLAALAVARRNARRLGVERIDWLAGDWLAAVRGRFDLIVANPPYLAEDDPHLDRDGLEHEPRMALVAGPDGLDAIRVIVRQAGSRLRPGGWLLLEHGYQQGTAVRGLLEAAGYRQVGTVRDLAGRERVSGGLRPA
ncbi:MAG: release factor glutamine methyltransferase [Lysobacteraceae bacterium]|nr:MAG: release factor glutamine methyltransferase [Xanthomonadaceae bacterium]